MAKTDNVKDLMVDIADAIRAKKGTSDLINPQDFSSEIASIETGGGGGGEAYSPLVIGFILFTPGLGDGYYEALCFDNWEGRDDVTFADLTQYYMPYHHNFSIASDGTVEYKGYKVYHNMDGDSFWQPEFSNPVKGSDKLVSTTYYVNQPMGM